MKYVASVNKFITTSKLSGIGDVGWFLRKLLLIICLLILIRFNQKLIGIPRVQFFFFVKNVPIKSFYLIIHLACTELFSSHHSFLAASLLEFN